MKTAKNKNRNSAKPSFILNYLSDKPLPNGRVREELVRQSIRTLGKDNGHEHLAR